MIPPRSILVALALLCGRFVFAQTVVDSVFQSRYPNRYSDPNNWLPAEVPNNTAAKNYNVNIGIGSTVEVDIDATISNLNLTGPFTGLTILEKTLSVSGTTNHLATGAIDVESGPSGEAKFNAGNLSNFSNHTLSGNFSLGSRGLPATLQFNGAAITTLSNGFFGLSGPLARIVDEFGNDALINLARIDKLGTLILFGHNLVTNAPFQNDGVLSIQQTDTAATFTATVGLTNFDPATRTLTGGTFGIGEYGPAYNPAELRFNGADIVNLASTISMIGPTGRIADLAGADALRNFAHILPSGVLYLVNHDLTITGQFQNDGWLPLGGGTIFTVAGALTNFDPVSRTLSGGTFTVNDKAQLKFAGADIVHNGAHLGLSDAGKITDLAGNDALRNFRDNLSSGEFILSNGIQFTAPGDFTNAGRIEIAQAIINPRNFGSPARFTVPSGFRYTQSGGETVDDGILTADHIDILGGSVSAVGSFVGDVMVKDATMMLSSGVTIQGNLTLSPGSHFRRFNLFGDIYPEISGKVTLAGTLEVDIPSANFVASTQTLTVLKSGQPLSGVFSNAPSGARIFTTDGKGSVVVTYDATAVYLSQYHLEPAPAQLLNLSSRAFLSRSDDNAFGDRAVLIAGFIISGANESKDIVVRGLGPSLSKSGVSAVLADPVLELHAADGSLIGTNDNWKDKQAAEISAAGLAPTDEREAALRAVLQPGTYSVVIKEKNGLGGNGLVEVYDVSQNTNSKLANISSRGFTDSNNLLIGGIIVAGAGQANDDVVVRVLGPQLRRNGILNAVEDPTLEVRNSNGTVIAFNDDWVGSSPSLDYTGLTPFNTTESALLLSLPRGNYTAIVRSKNNSGGVATVEFYDLRR